MFYKVKNKLKNRFYDIISDLHYGREIVKEWAIDFSKNKKTVRILDVGLGKGEDLIGIKKTISSVEVELFGVESYDNYRKIAEQKGIKVFSIDIEKERLPIENNFFDIIIINQVLEHTKEWYFIFDELNRLLNDSGMLIVGVPNLVSWHERLRLLFGKQPFNLDLLGPHIRGITHDNLIDFIENGGDLN